MARSSEIIQGVSILVPFHSANKEKMATGLDQIMRHGCRMIGLKGCYMGIGSSIGHQRFHKSRCFCPILHKRCKIPRWTKYTSTDLSEILLHWKGLQRKLIFTLVFISDRLKPFFTFGPNR